MISRLFGLSKAPTYESGESDNASGAKRAPGALYVATTLPTGTHDQSCVFMSCEAFVRQAAARFTFELVVVRTDDDADASASDANEQSKPLYELHFTIDKSSRFENDGNQFAWSDPSGKRYNLDVDGESHVAELRRALSVALFQNIHSSLPGPEDEKELDDLLTKPPPPTTDDLLVSKGELIRSSAEFFRFDPDADRFVSMMPEVIITINSAVVKEDNSRAYLMIIYHPQSGERVMEFEISNSLNSQFFSETLSLVWFMSQDPETDVTETLESGDVSTLLALSIKLTEAEDFVRFRNQFAVCLYEVTHNASVDDLKLKDDDISYIQNAVRDDVDPMDVDDLSDVEAEEEKEADRRQVREAGRASLGEPSDGMENSHMAIASNHDRTFVVRGNKMGVFQARDDGAQYKTAITFKDPKDSSSFTPSKVLLHQMDRSMLLLDPEDESRIMRMDLERGEVVDTWQGGLTSNTPVKTVHQSSKYANMTDEQQFVGVNRNQLLRMDPRTSEFIVQSKKYAPGTRARLECVSTTGQGYLAVASENGDIRLFDQIGKNAKTHLPGLGDSIIGIDVTEDGHFILATTAKYLLLIDTRVKGQEKGGFLKSMGKNKPTPRKLTIRNEDIVKYRMGQIHFTTAHFNTGSSMERSIVTSTGPFIVIWNFRQVKLGRVDCYKIKRYQDKVVADNFTYNDDGRIVVTLPNDVSVAKR